MKKLRFAGPRLTLYTLLGLEVGYPVAYILPHTPLAHSTIDFSLIACVLGAIAGNLVEGTWGSSGK